MQKEEMTQKGFRVFQGIQCLPNKCENLSTKPGNTKNCNEEVTQHDLCALYSYFTMKTSRKIHSKVTPNMLTQVKRKCIQRINKTPTQP
jgi:hypothetical protein